MDHAYCRQVLAATFNTTSPLLRLPSELRMAIFEYVLCGRTIHIGTRKADNGESGGQPRLPGEPPIKIMHALCSCRREWHEAYAMTKTPDVALQEHLDGRGFLKWSTIFSPDVLRSYYTDHRHCNGVLNDFNWQDYVTFPDRACHCPFPCPHYFTYRRKMIEQYGEGVEGLRLKHKISRYHISLLTTCRSIYKDCSLLPYSGNTFAFQHRLDMDLFLEKFLSPTQRDALLRFNVCIRSLVNPTLPRTIPRNIKILECFIVNDDGNHWSDLEPWKGKFRDVQVISGWDGRRSVSDDGRLVRRERAKKLERFLVKPI